MNTKICTKCGLEKELNNFRKTYNKKYDKYYIRNYCIECQKEYSKNNSKKYYHSKEGKKKRDEYLLKNREQILEKSRIRTSIYRQTHKEKIKEKNKIYREQNKEKINQYFKDRYKNDHIYKFKNTIRNSIRMSFRRKGKLQPSITKEILGCDFDYLIKYLIQTYENNYNEKWNWKYLKDVDIDHIIPLAIANTEDEIKKLCYYKNLQLLKTEDNLKKGSRLN